MKKSMLVLKKSVVAMALVSCGNSVYAATQLEEVIVTATFRASSLQDVPVSVNAVSGEKMLEAGIDKIEDLSAYVPNLSMSETGIGTNIYIRGIGSGINPGFEQSVGMYFDGVAYSRAQLTRAPFLDLARVEVLRGPQNILYGKNSIAGALSLVSARPGDEFEGRASLLYEPDHGEQVVDLTLSGPIADGLGGRLAIRKREMDGYIRNLTLDRDEPARDEFTARAILDWDISDALTAMVKLEAGSFDVSGRQIEIVNDQPSTSSNPELNGRSYSQILVGAFGADPSTLNNSLDYQRSSNGDFSNNDTQNFTLNVDYSLSDGSQFTFITGVLSYEFEEVCDCDFTGANVFSVPFDEEYTQYSQEVRWVSAVGERFDHIGGAYIHKSDLDFFDSIVINSNIIPGAVTGLTGNPDAGAAIANTLVPRNFTTETDLFSVFWQTTWNVNDRLRATLGLRYSDESKDGSRSMEVTDLSGVRKPDVRDPNVNGGVLVDDVLASVFKVERHDIRGSRDESQVAPSLNVQFDVNDDVMAYATITTGNKAGGFDARSNASPSADLNVAGKSLEGSFEYEEEKATSFETGAKLGFLEGRGELNIAAFFTKYDDLQVSIFDGTLGFNVGNAGAAETMGLEFDGRLLLTERLTMTASIAFLDFEFTDFENGQCYQGQTPTTPASTPDGADFCDYKGKANQYVADYSGNIGFSYEHSLARDLIVRAQTDIVFTDDYNSSQNLDPSQQQDGYTKLNARLAISSLAQGWELALVGKNLTDEDVVSYSNDTPLANSSFKSVNHYAFVERPRSVAIQMSINW